MSTPLFNIETGYYEDVPDSDIISRVESGKYAAPKTITVTGKYDEENTVSYDDYKNKWSKKDYTNVVPTSELSRRQGEKYLESKYDRGLTDQLLTGVEQFADTLLLGIPGRTILDTEGFRERQKRNRTGAVIGQVAGIVGPVIADVATAGAATPVLVSSVAKLGAKLGTKEAARIGAKEIALSAIKNAPINVINRTARLAGEAVIPGAVETAGKRIAKSTIVGAAEGAGLEASRQVTGEVMDVLLNEDENIIDGHVILGNALFGGAVGGGFGALSEGFSAASNKISRLKKGITSADTAVAEETIAPKILSKEDIAASSKLKRSTFEDGSELGANDLNIKNSLSRTTAKDISVVERDIKSLKNEITKNRSDVADTRATWKNVEGYDADEIIMNLDEASAAAERLLGKEGLLVKIKSGKIKLNELHEIQNDLTTIRNTGMIMESAGMKVPKIFMKEHTEQIASIMRKEGIDSSVFNSKFLSDDDISTALSLGLITQPSAKTIASALDQSGMLKKSIELAKNIPGVGRFASAAEKLIDTKTATAIGIGSLMTGGAGNLLAAAPAAAAAGAAGAAAYGLGKGLVAMYKNPSIGGLLTSSTADVLKRSVIVPGDNSVRNGSDEELLRQFTNELRQADENNLIRSTIQTLGPLTPQSTIDAVIRRKNYLNSVLDKEIPRSSDPVSAIIDKPKVRPGAARRVSEAVKGSSHPFYFLLAADAGKLTKEAMDAASATYPETVSFIRTQILTRLGTVLNGNGLDPKARSRVKLILGAQDSGSYMQLMKKLTSGGQSVSGQQYQMPDPSKSIKLNSAKNYQDPLTSATFKMI